MTFPVSGHQILPASRFPCPPFSPVRDGMVEWNCPVRHCGKGEEGPRADGYSSVQTGLLGGAENATQKNRLGWKTGLATFRPLGTSWIWVFVFFFRVCACVISSLLCVHQLWTQTEVSLGYPFLPRAVRAEPLPWETV